MGRIGVLITQVITCAALVCMALPVQAQDGQMPLSQRLSASQYRQSIADIFGPFITVSGRFDPEYREEGLLAVGSRSATMTPSGIERYSEIAAGIAAQVVSPANRGTLMSCQPASADAADDACARQFLSETGRLLYRRALPADELDTKVALARQVSEFHSDFYAGVSVILADMLISPNFLYRHKVLEPDPDSPGHQRLDAYSKATVLSFFLWNTAPDDLLLKAAESGEIHTQRGMKQQVDRMLQSPNVESGVRAFFADMLGFSEFETLAKDPQLYPRFTPKVITQAQEQTLRTIVDLLLVRQGDYRDLITTPRTFLTRSLGAAYDVPVIDLADNGQPEHWVVHEYPQNDPRIGILSHVSFVALHSPSGRSSPTDRGKALREYLLCQAVPSPPADVSFAVVQETESVVHRTVRERLIAHATDAACSGCHKITDPIGLAMENFDTSGGFRTHENGAQIDTTGDLNGKTFDGPAGLAQAVRNDPALPACAVQKAFAYAAGWMPPRTSAQLRVLAEGFQKNRFNFIELLREIAMSEALYSVPAPTGAMTAAR